MPIVRDPLDAKVSQWHFLAFHLRFLREKEGLSLTQCGKIINAARSTVSNMEAGRVRPREDQLVKLDEKYGTGELLQLMLWYARMAHDPDWGRQLDKYEERAISIKTYHGQAVPLALQTDEYTWACVQASKFKDLEGTMTRRVARKKSYWEKGDSLLTWAVIDESVVARVVGGVEVMKKQYEHLLALAELPQVSLRVLPFRSGAHMGFEGSVQIIGLEERDVAYSGAQHGGRLIESPSEVRELSVMFDRIGVKAASEEASREIINQYLERVQ